MVKFFEVVEAANPKFWALENVPRIKGFLNAGFCDRSSPLYRFRGMVPNIEVIDFAEFGVPQSRKRCIAGNYPFELLRSYSEILPRRSLGDIIRSLNSNSTVVDPVWGFELAGNQLTEMEFEAALDEEELRMNREAKAYHPVYNGMNFPDRLDLPSRTITATCSKVSRESIVVPGSEGIRRLNLRERASAQGFPINYQFYGSSFSEKAKLIGNAIPPYFTYLFAQAANGVGVEEIVTKLYDASLVSSAKSKPSPTVPKKQTRHFSRNRGFRAVLPGFRFKSGMRFDLSNSPEDRTAWRVQFFYGPSTNIQSVPLNLALLDVFRSSDITRRIEMSFGADFAEIEHLLARTSPEEMQLTWSRRGIGLSPFSLVDCLGHIATEIHNKLASTPVDDQHAIIGYVLESASRYMTGTEISGAKKLSDNSLKVFSGMYVGAWFNSLQWHRNIAENAKSA